MEYIRINSWNETDPLRSLLVGNINNSYNIPDEFPCKIRSMNTCKNNIRMNNLDIENANILRDNFIELLKNDYSIKVVQSDTIDHSNSIKTPYWNLSNTNENSCPRDTFSIIGNTILEAPMSWRCRYFESLVYHDKLLKIWTCNKDCRWIQPPKPLMTDNLYNNNYPINLEDRQTYNLSMLNNTEPVFDAADILRCGKDLFVQNGFTTNSIGIEWLRREFGSSFRIHEIKLENNITPTHLDAELTILRPGLLMTCPERKINNDLFNDIKNEENDWDIIEAPYPINCKMQEGCFSSKWLSMNVLSIDENTIIVEENEKPLIELLEDYSFNVIPVPFYNAYKFGGGFHCQTLDLERDGVKKSYFPYFDRKYDK